MTIMAKHTSAKAHAETPQLTGTTRTPHISEAVKRRARYLINYGSIDIESQTLLRYSLEIEDPHITELVRIVDAGQRVLETLDFLEMPDTTYEDDPTDEKVETLARMICGGGDRCVAALLVLMGAIENSASPKVLANVAKHFAFIRCGELNLYRLADNQVSEVEMELLGGNELTG
jgi:hypothetical protein